MIKFNPVIFVNFPPSILVRIYSVTKQFKVIESLKVVISSKDTDGKPYNSGKKMKFKRDENCLNIVYIHPPGSVLYSNSFLENELF